MLLNSTHICTLLTMAISTPTVYGNTYMIVGSGYYIIHGKLIIVLTIEHSTIYIEYYISSPTLQY